MRIAFVLLLAIVGCGSEAIEHGGGAAGAAPVVDVEASQFKLTLNSSFTCINSDSGSAIWLSRGPMDIVRCYVMSQGFCQPNWWSCTYFGGTGVSASCVESGGVSWRTRGCNANGCIVDRCSGSTCVQKGTALYTADGNTLFNGSNFDGFTSVTCQQTGGGTPGHPILKRYKP